MKFITLAAWIGAFTTITTAALADCQLKLGGIQVSVDVSGPGDIEIISRRGSAIHRYLQNIVSADRVDFACGTDVVVGDTYAVVRSGKFRDRISFFGIRADGVIIATGMHLNREYQGSPQDVEIERLPASFVARFDHEGKRSVRFCFHNGQWLGSDESGDDQAPTDCRIPIPTVSESAQIQ